MATLDQRWTNADVCVGSTLPPNVGSTSFCSLEQRWTNGAPPNVGSTLDQRWTNNALYNVESTLDQQCPLQHWINVGPMLDQRYLLQYRGRLTRGMGTECLRDKGSHNDSFFIDQLVQIEVRFIFVAIRVVVWIIVCLQCNAHVRKG